MPTGIIKFRIRKELADKMRSWGLNPNQYARKLLEDDLRTRTPEERREFLEGIRRRMADGPPSLGKTLGEFPEERSRGHQG